MPKELSREEEQRGWRRSYLWVLPIALVLGTALLFAPSLMTQVTNQKERGMDQIQNQSPPEANKQALGPARIEVASSTNYGEFLTDGSGRPLYLFKGDRRGEGGNQAESDCYDDCAKSWPPLLTTEEPKAADAVRANLLGTLARKDGSTQVTYNGWPLYRYVQDVGPEGTVAGHDVEDFGEEWYLVSPAGEEARGVAKSGS